MVNADGSRNLREYARIYYTLVDVKGNTAHCLEKTISGRINLKNTKTKLELKSRWKNVLRENETHISDSILLF